MRVARVPGDLVRARHGRDQVRFAGVRGDGGAAYGHLLGWGAVSFGGVGCEGGSGVEKGGGGVGVRGRIDGYVLGAVNKG